VKFLQNHKRWLIGAFAIFAAALIIWLVGPLIDIGDPRLLEAPARRGIIILLILLGWLSWEGRRLWRERQSNRELIDQLGQAEDPDVAQSREEAEALRGRFTEALSTLKSVKLGGARLLYQLPWYMFIGAPGSGKTTALVNSGLKFPLAQGASVALR
jgi:type VI secretion system protein ImpL